MSEYKFTTRRIYLFLLILTIATTLSFQVWRTLLNNYAVDVAGLDGRQFGMIGSIREIPGLLSFIVIYMLLLLREHRLAAVSVVLLGVGVSITGYFPSFYGLALTTLLMSIGFHYFQTVKQSLLLQSFGYTEAPLVMARLQSLSAATNVIIGLTVIFVSGITDYKMIFLIAGILAVLAGLYSLTIKPDLPDKVPQKKKILLRSKYWLFYALTFMAGTRRQIFSAFAVFLLVKKFQFSLQQVAILFVINNVINYFANPVAAKFINRFGERKALTFEYAGLTIIFASYAFIENPLFGALLYILDNIVFNFNMGIKTFFQKIAERSDIAPSMAVSSTINHIAAVIIPVLGGVLWMADYRIVFLGAAGLSLISFILSQFIDSEMRIKSKA